MKKLNDSPELIIVAAGLIFAGILMLAALFYTPPLSTATVIYSGNTTEPSAAGSQIGDSQAAAGQPAESTRQAETAVPDGTSAPAPAASSAAETAAPDTSGKININTADLDTLCTLNGVGEVKAQRIIDYRTANGGFKSIEEIKNVSGIGDKTYENIKDSITV